MANIIAFIKPSLFSLLVLFAIQLILNIMDTILLTCALLLLMLAIQLLSDLINSVFYAMTALKRSMAQSSLVNKYCHISNASKRKVLAALTEDRSMTSIAREHNLSVNTVQRVLESCSSRFYDDFDYLPEHLAFDEFKGVGKKLHFICLDGDSHQVVQILRTRFKPETLRYFSPLRLEQTVSMDLNCYYPIVAKELFPNAQIVIDRFHMVQMLTRSFNSLRVQK